MTFVSADDPYRDCKKYHMAWQTNHRGGVSALCFKRWRSINLSVALWTIDPKAVTCAKCRRIMKEMEIADG